MWSCWFRAVFSWETGGVPECPVPETGTRHVTITGATVGVPTPVGALVGQTCTAPGVPLSGSQSARQCMSCGSFTQVPTRCSGNASSCCGFVFRSSSQLSRLVCFWFFGWSGCELVRFCFHIQTEVRNMGQNFWLLFSTWKTQDVHGLRNQVWQETQLLDVLFSWRLGEVSWQCCFLENLSGIQVRKGIRTFFLLLLRKAENFGVTVFFPAISVPPAGISISTSLTETTILRGTSVVFRVTSLFLQSSVTFSLFGCSFCKFCQNHGNKPVHTKSVLINSWMSEAKKNKTFSFSVPFVASRSRRLQEIPLTITSNQIQQVPLWRWCVTMWTRLGESWKFRARGRHP